MGGPSFSRSLSLSRPPSHFLCLEGGGEAGVGGGGVAAVGVTAQKEWEAE